ncbi:uncharacterized protein EV422DRAFT_504138 [Fimicolochytrium jonesii]|uniref:uncharacterized protein n=1 Tax=Fimicolochytrium jonesii TaxID=1396493 RepID=UPI0022FDBB22|nr:uncharacterized protein EV422DRAFT_504138 [Fimicolochytrium jonesii]KAI8824069.1 hypothetical protein EV422DRAFT_504138 [Fimicolochytrium jonesii]
MRWCNAGSRADIIVSRRVHLHAASMYDPFAFSVFYATPHPDVAGVSSTCVRKTTVDWGQLYMASRQAATHVHARATMGICAAAGQQQCGRHESALPHFKGGAFSRGTETRARVYHGRELPHGTELYRVGTFRPLTVQRIHACIGGIDRWSRALLVVAAHRANTCRNDMMRTCGHRRIASKTGAIGVACVFVQPVRDAVRDFFPRVEAFGGKVAAYENDTNPSLIFSDPISRPPANCLQGGGEARAMGFSRVFVKSKLPLWRPKTSMKEGLGVRGDLPKSRGGRPQGEKDWHSQGQTLERWKSISQLLVSPMGSSIGSFVVILSDYCYLNTFQAAA